MIFLRRKNAADSVNEKCSRFFPDREHFSFKLQNRL
jgi:hypothetical protein